MTGPPGPPGRPGLVVSDMVPCSATKFVVIGLLLRDSLEKRWPGSKFMVFSVPVVQKN